MKFKEYLKQDLKDLNESTLTIYHGDNHETKKIDPKLMMNGNVQEGIGIYFGNLVVAKSYGKDIVQAEVNQKDFKPSRGTVKRNLKLAYNILRDLWHIDPESMYYLITDWVEIVEIEDITHDDIRLLAQKMGSDEVRNFQITLAEAFGVENFVKIWNKVYPKNTGTYDKDTGFYAIINPKVPLVPFKEQDEI